MERSRRSIRVVRAGLLAVASLVLVTSWLRPARAEGAAEAPAAPVAKVPELVISGSGEAPPAEAPRDETHAADAEALSAELSREYGALAEAATDLKSLEVSAQRLACLAPKDRKLQQLAGEIQALKKELAASWRLAGRAASDLSRTQRAPKKQVPARRSKAAQAAPAAVAPPARVAAAR